MANHASAEKEARKSLKRCDINKSRNSRIKTYIKKVHTSVEAGHKEDANKFLREAQSEIMRGVTKGVLRKNTAARRVSRLAQMVKKLSLSSN